MQFLVKNADVDVVKIAKITGPDFPIIVISPEPN